MSSLPDKIAFSGQFSFMKEAISVTAVDDSNLYSLAHIHKSVINVIKNISRFDTYTLIYSLKLIPSTFDTFVHSRVKSRPGILILDRIFSSFFLFLSFFLRERAHGFSSVVLFSRPQFSGDGWRRKSVLFVSNTTRNRESRILLLWSISPTDFSSLIEFEWWSEKGDETREKMTTWSQDSAMSVLLIL